MGLGDPTHNLHGPVPPVKAVGQEGYPRTSQLRLDTSIRETKSHLSVWLYLEPVGIGHVSTPSVNGATHLAQKLTASQHQHYKSQDLLYFGGLAIGHSFSSKLPNIDVFPLDEIFKIMSIIRFT